MQINIATKKELPVDQKHLDHLAIKGIIDAIAQLAIQENRNRQRADRFKEQLVFQKEQLETIAGKFGKNIADIEKNWRPGKIDRLVKKADAERLDFYLNRYQETCKRLRKVERSVLSAKDVQENLYQLLYKQQTDQDIEKIVKMFTNGFFEDRIRLNCKWYGSLHEKLISQLAKEIASQLLVSVNLPYDLTHGHRQELRFVQITMRGNDDHH